MIDRLWAEKFTQEWIANWNARDLDAILSHYDRNVVFRSPVISTVVGGGKTFVVGLAELRDYWRKALAVAKDLRFDKSRVLIGSDAITILYRNHRNQNVAETLVFDESSKVVEGIVTYN